MARAISTVWVLVWWEIVNSETFSPFLSAALAVPLEQGYYPRWTQCVSEEALEIYTNASDPASFNESIHSCSYNKKSEDTVLKISWDGNIGVTGCQKCCMRWYITIDDEECSYPGPIDVALVQDLTDISYSYDLIRPASVFGICSQTGGMPVDSGVHNVDLWVGLCDDAGEVGDVPGPSDTVTGLNSVSRFVIEEIPAEKGDCRSKLVQPRRWWLCVGCA